MLDSKVACTSPPMHDAVLALGVFGTMCRCDLTIRVLILERVSSSCPHGFGIILLIPPAVFPCSCSGARSFQLCLGFTHLLRARSSNAEGRVDLL